MELRAVIFDLGGVVLESPLHYVAAFERERELPEGFVAALLGSYGDEADTAWHALERGEIDLDRFCERFDAAASAAGEHLSSRELMAGIADFTTVRPPMLAAVREVRAAGFSTAALTNIWAAPGPLDERLAELRPQFDAFVESYRVGARKPEPAIYTTACHALDVDPGAAIFLDDIGGNLKPARAMGMATIKVVDAQQALADLGSALGLTLGGAGAADTAR